LLPYPKKSLVDAIKAKPELVKSLWQALKSITPEALSGEGRVYGGELYKMEPKDSATFPPTALLPPYRVNLSCKPRK